MLAINLSKYIEAFLINLALLFLAPKKLKRPSDYFLTFLLFGLLTPLLIFYALTDQSRSTLYIVLLGYFLVSICRMGAPIKFPTLKEGRTLALVFLAGSTLGVSVWFLWSGGLRFFNLDITEVYKFRREVGSVINVGIMGYVNIWAYKVFGPTILAIALWKRHFWLAGLAFALHVYWFGISSHKAVFFYPFLVLFLWIWFRHTKALSIIPLAMTGVVSAALVLYLNFDIKIPSSLFIRRVFFAGANNTFYYYNFFSQNELIYWSNSILSSFFDYPYNFNPARLIGESKGTDGHINNTFLSTGYMHAGLLGVIFYSVLTGLLFRLIDSISASGIPPWVAVAILIVPSRSLLLSADLPTALVTHGIAIGIVILFLLRRHPQDRNQRQ